MLVLQAFQTTVVHLQEISPESEQYSEDVHGPLFIFSKRAHSLN